MKVLCVFEYDEKLPNFSLTAIDSRRTAYGGNMTINRFDISQYSDIFYVSDGEDRQKFDKSGLDIEEFVPISESAKGSVRFSSHVINQLLEWAQAKRAWVYKSARMTGPDRTKFDELFKRIEWKQPDD